MAQIDGLGTVASIRVQFVFSFCQVFVDNFQISEETADKARQVAADSTAAAVRDQILEYFFSFPRNCIFLHFKI